uniref:Uncharacterized protein LOC111101995 n=1 Tax=Crassostrea virginica TaxID=6565 RepID=A0A8B8AII4_CRAVI|nr:uncharacterized protein LOC111101995 [Crassostrea virginica]
MDPTRISTHVTVRHCSLCQRDTKYYCYGCQQDLCLQCKKITRHRSQYKIPRSNKLRRENKKPTKKVKRNSARFLDPKQVKRFRCGDSKQVISARSLDPDNHEPCLIPLTEHIPHKFFLPVSLSSLERKEIQRRQYCGRRYHLRGETIYYRSVLLEGRRYDRETGHKTVTIRGQSKAVMRGQGLKDLIDDVLAGDLADRCIIQKTRMTRHMTKLLRYYHRYEQLSETMETRPFKFLRIMTQKHRDMLVSDVICYAVVATSGKGIHRFSYTGPPSSASRLKPDGICTDVMSHILVCDGRTTTVQMLDSSCLFSSPDKHQELTIDRGA